MTKFSDRLMQAARHAGVGETQSEIAADLGLKRQTVNHWFLKGEPDGENVSHIAKRWGVNREWLASGDGEMLPQPSQDSLSHEERDLVRSYRLAPANARPVILSMLRAARKAIVTVPLMLPGFMAPKDADAGILHKQNCVTAFARAVADHTTDCISKLVSFLRNMRKRSASSLEQYSEQSIAHA